MNIKIISKNRSAWHNFHILEKYEAGIVLHGSEVKALREGKANLKQSYIRFFSNELFIVGLHIGEYSNKGYLSHISVKDRKLLLHRKELKKLNGKIVVKGNTLIPLTMYFKNNLVKVEFALSKGKKLYDKRKSKMDKDVSRQLDRELKGRLKND